MNLVDYLLESGSFSLQRSAADWQAAVGLGCDILEAQAIAEPRYREAIIAMTQELGPWYVLAPGLAMPHARPEEGVLKNGFALLTLAQPVAFGHPDNDPVDILVFIAATSAKSMNEEAIVQVADLLDNEQRVNLIRQAKNPAELAAALRS